MAALRGALAVVVRFLLLTSAMSKTLRAAALPLLTLLAACGGQADSSPVDHEAPVSAMSLTVPGKAQTTSNLNLRAGPGSGFSVLTVIPAGGEVDVLEGPQSGYYKARYLNQTGWAHGSYLRQGRASFRPRPGTSWQIQLSGTIDTSFSAAMYDIDLFDAPQAVIDALRAKGRAVVCYFSAGSYEDWRGDAGAFPAAALGKGLDGWPGERWLDVRHSGLRTVMKARLDRAKARGCDGVDPDNVDGYSNDTGFPLSAADQLDYNRFLAREAHARGLTVGLKNDVDQIPQLVADFDWQINEECFQYNECDKVAPFVNAGKAVFQLEYGSSARAAAVCSKANARNLDTLVKPLELTASRISCR